MSFLPKPGEIIEDDDLYELSGDEDNRLRQEYEWITKGSESGCDFHNGNLTPLYFNSSVLF